MRPRRVLDRDDEREGVEATSDGLPAVRQTSALLVAAILAAATIGTIVYLALLPVARAFGAL
jgi:hypothetical protein